MNIVNGMAMRKILGCVLHSNRADKLIHLVGLSAASEDDIVAPLKLRD
jgi:hypothetical protein